MTDLVVRTPASSANLGAGFDVCGMAVTLYADIGTGDAPDGAHQMDSHHPGRTAFDRMGGTGPIWLRCNIPMARGLGFSGAVRVGAAAIGAVQAGGSIDDQASEILAVAAELEGHGDNVVASLFGGIAAFVDDRAVPFPVGPLLGAASFVAWVPDVTTSTDASRRVLPDMVERRDAVHNIGRATQFVLAVAHDDPDLLAGATDDRLHQPQRVPAVPGAAEALEAGASAGAWCGWLSGSGPTVGFLVDPVLADSVAASLPSAGHAKVLGIDLTGARLL